MKEIQNVVQKLLREQESAAGAGAGIGIRTGTKNIKSPPVYRGDLMSSDYSHISHDKLSIPEAGLMEKAVPRSPNIGVQVNSAGWFNLFFRAITPRTPVKNKDDKIMWFFSTTAMKFYKSFLLHVQWNWYKGIKSYEKHIYFIICLARSLQNHVYSPCHERPPVLRDHKIKWSLYTGFTVSALPDHDTGESLNEE